MPMILQIENDINYIIFLSNRIIPSFLSEYKAIFLSIDCYFHFIFTKERIKLNELSYFYCTVIEK